MNAVIRTEVSIPCGRGELYGVLFLPEGANGRIPCFVCSHGIFSSYEMTSPSARELAKRGFAAVCFDFRGCSYSRRSGGELTGCSVLTEAEELKAVLKWAREQPFADEGRIYLMGQSLGGVVTALVAAEKTQDIAGLLLMYPAFNMPEVLRSLFPDAASIPEVIPNFMAIPGLDLGKRFFEDALSAPVREAVRDLKKPVYLLHGNADKLVPIRFGEDAAKAYGGKFVLVKGAEHGFDLTAEQAEDVVRFFGGNE